MQTLAGLYFFKTPFASISNSHSGLTLYISALVHINGHALLQTLMHRGIPRQLHIQTGPETHRQIHDIYRLQPPCPMPTRRPTKKSTNTASRWVLSFSYSRSIRFRSSIRAAAAITPDVQPGRAPIGSHCLLTLAETT